MSKVWQKQKKCFLDLVIIAVERVRLEELVILTKVKGVLIKAAATENVAAIRVLIVTLLTAAEVF